ncbi:ssDNA endonuclease and repair protein rad10 [Blyttiomyces sp. JEL0837]|nr:ssDNA endonuclease and repair protein rad10 [Blyttiomyces sp. JEL0837]
MSGQAQASSNSTTNPSANSPNPSSSMNPSSSINPSPSKKFIFKVPDASTVEAKRKEMLDSVASTFIPSSSLPVSSSSNSSSSLASLPRPQPPAPSSLPKGPIPQFQANHPPSRPPAPAPALHVSSNSPAVPIQSSSTSQPLPQPQQQQPSATLGGSSTTSTTAPTASRRTIGNKIVVNPCQKGNPLLKHIKTVPLEYGDILPDYQVGQTSSALYLSLRYHRLKPEYIYERIKATQHQFLLKILLCVVDIDDHEQVIRELTKICVLGGLTLILAFSQEEAARYLENFKAYENKPPDAIKERVESDNYSRIVDCLTQIKSVNKTDVMTLVSNFGSLKNIMEASAEELMNCPGFGEQKVSYTVVFNVFRSLLHMVRRLIDAVNAPFLTHKRRKV